MKTINKFFMAYLAVVAMTACNNDIDSNFVDSEHIKFTMNIGSEASSRISMDDGSFSAKFSEGDEIGIFVDNSEQSKYSTTDGTNWNSTSPIKVQEGTVNTYRAYYPFTDLESSKVISKKVDDDQESNGYLKNDFLFAKATTSDKNVTLNFSHLFTLIEVKLEGNALSDDNDKSVTLNNVASDCTFDISSENFTLGSSKSTITMDKLSVSHTYRAIIPAQTIAKNEKLFTITVGETKYLASYSADLKLERNKYISITIPINNGETNPEFEVEFNSSISNWQQGTAEGEIQVTENNSIVDEVSELTEKKDKEVHTSESNMWFYLTHGDITATYGVTDITDKVGPVWKKQIDASIKSGGNSYWRSAFGYLYINNNAINNKNLYKLSLKAKAKKDVEFTTTCRNADNSKSFGIRKITDTGTKSTLIKIKIDSRDWKDYESIIDFSKQSEAVGTPDDKKPFVDSNSDDCKKIQIRFYANGSQDNPAEFSITDVKLEPYNTK